MARPNRIWFRKDIGWWMVTLGGKKIRLVEGKNQRKLAEQKFRELMAVSAIGRRAAVIPPLLVDDAAERVKAVERTARPASTDLGCFFA
jgi:hypothetical protein